MILEKIILEKYYFPTKSASGKHKNQKQRFEHLKQKRCAAIRRLYVPNFVYYVASFLFQNFQNFDVVLFAFFGITFIIKGWQWSGIRNLGAGQRHYDQGVYAYVFPGEPDG